MPHEKKEELIEEAISLALGDLDFWSRPKTKPSVGPAFPEVLDVFEKDLNELRNDIRPILSRRSVEDLRKQYLSKDAHGELLLNELHGVHFGIAKRIKRLSARVPAWFIGGWCVAEYEFELKHWRGYSRCTLKELVLLSVGLDPRRVGYDALFKRYGHSKHEDEMLLYLEDRYDAFANGLGLDPESGDDGANLEEFYSWIKTNSIEIDARLRRMLRERANKLRMANQESDPSRVATTGQVDRIHRRSYDFHARLVYSIAVEKYGLSDSSKIGKVAKAIQNDVELQGSTATLKSIRELLKSGMALINFGNDNR